MCVIERHLTFIYPLPCYVTGLALRGSYLWALHHRYGHSAPRRRNGRVADMQRQQRAETARSSGSGGRDRVRGSVGGYDRLVGCARASMAAVGCGRKLGSEAMPRACGRPVRQRGFGLRDGHGAEGAVGRWY